MNKPNTAGFDRCNSEYTIWGHGPFGCIRHSKHSGPHCSVITGGDCVMWSNYRDFHNEQRPSRSRIELRDEYRHEDLSRILDED
jgi:hypothetical protein